MISSLQWFWFHVIARTNCWFYYYFIITGIKTCSAGPTSLEEETELIYAPYGSRRNKYKQVLLKLQND